MNKNIFIILSGVILFFVGCSAGSISSLQAKADAGDASYQYEVGMKYYFGQKGVKQDKNLGIKYLKKAANQNFPKALKNLGSIYYKEKKYNEAFNYYKLAVDQNYTNAKLSLGDMYQKGLGTKKDILKALKLYKEAYREGKEIGMLGIANSYKDLKKYNKAIKSYKTYVKSKTSRQAPHGTKSIVCLEVMELYDKIGDINKAYIWGATGVIAGVFDGPYKDYDKHLAVFEKIDKKIKAKQKEKFAKDIAKMHYDFFVKYEYYLKSNPSLKFKHGYINIYGSKLISSTGYVLMKNKETVQAINYLKTKKDEKSRINLAIFYAKLSSQYANIGSISPYYSSAQNEIDKSLNILDNYNIKSLKTLKEVLKKKSFILKSLSKYQDQMHKKFYSKKVN